MDPVQQQALIERLYENESLTSNLTDAEAKPLLQWAEAQIRDGANAELVIAAVNAANQSGAEGIQALLVQARAFLKQHLDLQPADAPRAADHANTTMAASAPAASTANAAEIGMRAAPTTPTTLSVSGENLTLSTPSATPQTPTAPAKTPPAKKSRRSTKRKKKSNSVFRA
ncbi:MAG: hypothetical protein HY741_23305 [Chloroflexi bacterium]|nr:hypothetical protein [Chloroflexota bacterium]